MAQWLETIQHYYRFSRESIIADGVILLSMLEVFYLTEPLLSRLTSLVGAAQVLARLADDVVAVLALDDHFRPPCI